MCRGNVAGVLGAQEGRGTHTKHTSLERAGGRIGGATGLPLPSCGRVRWEACSQSRELRAEVEGLCGVGGQVPRG